PFHSAGAWHLRGGGELAVHLDLSSAAAARRAFALLRDLRVRSELRTYRRLPFDRPTRYQLHVELAPDAAEVLRDASVASSETALRLDEHAVIAATRAEANRLANADDANLVRTTKAAHEQLRAIRALEGEALPAKLQEIAELRLKHPYLSLTELAAKCRPP